MPISRGRIETLQQSRNCVLVLNLSKRESGERADLRIAILRILIACEDVYQCRKAAWVSDTTQGQNRSPSGAAVWRKKRLQEIIGDGSLVFGLNYFWIQDALRSVALERRFARRNSSGWKLSHCCRGYYQKSESNARQMRGHEH